MVRPGAAVLITKGQTVTRYTAYEAQVWARKQRFAGDTAAKIVLMVLADYADEHGTCYPGVELIAEDAELSRSTVLRRLKALAAAGLIEVQRRVNHRGERTSNRYLLQIDVKVTAEQWLEVVEQVKTRLPSEKEEEVQGVNVTLGSEAPPKCHAERGAKVSPGDTGTTRGTTSREIGASASAPSAAQEQTSQPTLALVGTPAPSEAVSGALSGFSDFWSAYPRKVSKAAAERAWSKAMRKTNGRPEVVMAGLAEATEFWTRTGRKDDYVPYPATWLNAEGWLDVLPAAQPAAEQPVRPASPWETAPSASDIYSRSVGE